MANLMHFIQPQDFDFQAAIVDLDGTMVDTLGDFTAALDVALYEQADTALQRDDVGLATWLTQRCLAILKLFSPMMRVLAVPPFEELDPLLPRRELERHALGERVQGRRLVRERLPQGHRRLVHLVQHQDHAGDLRVLRGGVVLADEVLRARVVTAEGVETVEQLRFLKSLRCDVAQGYLIAHPLEADALPPWCDDFKRRWPELAG